MAKKKIFACLRGYRTIASFVYHFSAQVHPTGFEISGGVALWKTLAQLTSYSNKNVSNFGALHVLAWVKN